MKDQGCNLGANQRILSQKISAQILVKELQNLKTVTKQMYYSKIKKYMVKGALTYSAISDILNNADVV